MCRFPFLSLCHSLSNYYTNKINIHLASQTFTIILLSYLLTLLLQKIAKDHPMLFSCYHKPVTYNYTFQPYHLHIIVGSHCHQLSILVYISNLFFHQLYILAFVSSMCRPPHSSSFSTEPASTHTKHSNLQQLQTFCPAPALASSYTSHTCFMH